MQPKAAQFVSRGPGLRPSVGDGGGGQLPGAASSLPASPTAGIRTHKAAPVCSPSRAL